MHPRLEYFSTLSLGNQALCILIYLILNNEFSYYIAKRRTIRTDYTFPEYSFQINKYYTHSKKPERKIRLAGEHPLNNYSFEISTTPSQVFKTWESVVLI